MVVSSGDLWSHFSRLRKRVRVAWEIRLGEIGVLVHTVGPRAAGIELECGWIVAGCRVSCSGGAGGQVGGGGGAVGGEPRRRGVWRGEDGGGCGRGGRAGRAGTQR